MGLNTTLNATPREVRSSNYAGRLRAKGLLPIVYYGHDLEKAQSLTINYADFKTAFQNPEGNKFLFTLNVEGQTPSPVLLKDFQQDPVSRKVIHADFLKIDPAKSVNVKVPLVLAGKALGVEKGGQLQQGEREISVSGIPSEIPSQIEADVTPLALGQSLHLSQVKLPEGLTLSKGPDLPVATIAIPKGVKIEAEVVAAAPVAATPDKKAAPEKKAAEKKAPEKKK
ncbi:MAG: 50S ribosomal protein L25 [Deltaproteobacteria bacterium]|nr:50S ribosomal protein L25 [Deltaproteobacteria bacterium]